jgi:glutathione S-transferase
MTYQYTALATLAMLAVYFVTGLLVGRARGEHKVKAPATEGPDAFNRVYRASMNTLEQLVLMLPALWIFALSFGDRWAGLLGLVWVIGRVMYVQGYISAADKRGLGFMIGFAALVVALVGSAGHLIWSILR